MNGIKSNNDGLDVIERTYKKISAEVRKVCNLFFKLMQYLTSTLTTQKNKLIIYPSTYI